MEWKDTTSYSQSDKERVPASWTIKSGKLAITVHRHIHYEKDDWLVSCYPFVDCKKLNNKDIELAKNEALNYISEYINNLLLDVNKII